MGKKLSQAKSATAQPAQSLTWRLADSGMDILERAGLAGLFMALRAARDAGVNLSPLTWRDGDLTPDSVTVHWTGPARSAFLRLMEYAWQIDGGLFFFPAIHDARDRAAFQQRAPIHGGIMQTFLQHPNTQPKLDAVTRLVEIEEQKTISVTFKPPGARVDDPGRGINPKTKRLHKKKVVADRVRPHEDLEKMFDRVGSFASGDVSLSNWIYPGIAGRYGSEGSWVGPPSAALLLMLAPTVCFYQRLQGEGGNWTVVIPDVRDLEEFATTRRLMKLNADFVDVASLGDAGLKFLAEYSTRRTRKQVRAGCRVVAMGYVRYYQGQSIRKAVLDVPADLTSVRRYVVLQRELPNTYQAIRPDSSGDRPAAKAVRSRRKRTEPANMESGPSPSGFIKLPAARGRIADNLVSGQAWYTDLSVPLVWDLKEAEADRERKKLRTSLERAWFQTLCYQRSKLMKLIAEDDMWDTEAEKVFVQAFWETLDSLYAQEAEATKRGGSATVEKRWERLEGELLRSLTQAKTRPLLRRALLNWFAKAGRQRSIGDHPAAIWRLVDHPEHWKKGRDLALLALASHRNKEQRESLASQKKGK